MNNHKNAKYDIKSLKYYAIVILLTMLFYFIGYNLSIFGVTNEAGFLGENMATYYLNLITGGSLSTFTFFALGMGPIISSSIIVQLLESELSKKVKSWRELGDKGKVYKDRLQYSITILLTLIIAVGTTLSIYNNAPNTLVHGLKISLLIIPLQFILAQTLLLFLAKKVDGVLFNSGTSLFLMYGIILNLITTLSFDMFTNTQLFIITTLFIIASVIIILVNESSLSINGTSFNFSNAVDQPLRLSFSQTGVIAIIYASPLMIIGDYFINKLSIENELIANMFNLGNANILTVIIYILLIVLFSVLYTYVTMDTDIISDNLLKQGYYIYDVNPGEDTSKFMKKVILKIGLIGGILIAAIAALPYIISLFYTLPGASLILSTGLIIMLHTSTRIYTIISVHMDKK